MSDVRPNLFFLIIYFWSTFAWCTADLGYSFQSGLINTTYQGADSGQVHMSSTVQMGAEVITSDVDSFTANSSMSLDPQTAIIRYLYAGVGKRFYVFSHTGRQRFHSANSQIEIVPRRQFFLTVEAGASQIVIKQVTPSLSIQGTVVEYGGGIGAIVPLSTRIGLLGSVSVAKGLGISAVAVDSTTTKIMLGLMIR